MLRPIYDCFYQLFWEWGRAAAVNTADINLKYKIHAIFSHAVSCSIAFEPDTIIPVTGETGGKESFFVQVGDIGATWRIV